MGDTRPWKLGVIVLGLILFVSLIFLVVFGLRLSNVKNIYKADLEQKLEDQENNLKVEFQKEKEVPTVKYKADDVFGNFEFAYPKVWYTNLRRSDSDPELQFLGNPSLIVMQDDHGPATAVRISVNKDKFQDRVTQIEDEIKSKELKFQIEDITLTGLKGKKYTGTPENGDKVISYVLLPLREKTLYIGTDDFNTYKENYEFVIKTFTLNR